MVCTLLLASPAFAQQLPPPNPNAAAQQAPQQVDVDGVVEDDAIAERLLGILDVTGWFSDSAVRVENGVVFLDGSADTEEYKQWAGDLAGNTQDVVAVVNRIAVRTGSAWDLTPALNELREMSRGVLRASPLIVLGLLLLAATWLVTRLSVNSARTLLRRQISSQLLLDVVSRAVAVPVFLIGLYLVLQVSGLTGMAATVIGGTGLLGLIVGFAFRDIAENFLASVLLSIQRPFATGDLVEVAGYAGYVQSVNTRSTLLMTQDGNHVQIPNATIYKSTITNLTANPNSRFDFVVGIGYEDSISRAQEVILGVLKEHRGVVDDPESLVLVEALGAATVNLRVYFWVDVQRFGHRKVTSAVIRLVKTALDAAGISLPDEAREVVFPAGVPVRMIDSDESANAGRAKIADSSVRISEKQTNAAEGRLTSDAEEIKEQARQARTPEGETNLLDPTE